MTVAETIWVTRAKAIEARWRTERQDAIGQSEGAREQIWVVGRSTNTSAIAERDIRQEQLTMIEDAAAGAILRRVVAQAGARIGGYTLVCGYHPSRQNTQTGRLTVAMLDAVFGRVRRLVENNFGVRARP